MIVNSELHCKFDKFKKTEIPTQVSFIEANPSLKLYSQKERNLQIIQKYGKAYYSRIWLIGIWIIGMSSLMGQFK